MLAPISTDEAKSPSQTTSSEAFEKLEQILQSMVRLKGSLLVANSEEAAKIPETTWKKRAGILAILRALPVFENTLRRELLEGYIRHIENPLRTIGVTIVGEIKHTDRVLVPVNVTAIWPESKIGKEEIKEYLEIKIGKILAPGFDQYDMHINFSIGWKNKPDPQKTLLSVDFFPKHSHERFDPITGEMRPQKK